jgi:hypothetical protein
VAGFARSEVFGGCAEHAQTSPEQQMIDSAWAES